MHVITRLQPSPATLASCWRPPATAAADAGSATWVGSVEGQFTVAIKRDYRPGTLWRGLIRLCLFGKRHFPAPAPGRVVQRAGRSLGPSLLEDSSLDSSLECHPLVPAAHSEARDPPPPPPVEARESWRRNRTGSEMEREGAAR